MNTYALISADLAARLGLKRLTIGILATSVATNVLLAAGLLFKKDSVTTVLVPVGINETTHPMSVGETHVDQDYLMLVARDLLSLATNVTPQNADFNRETLLRHVSPASFGAINELLTRQAQTLKRLHASSLFSVQSMTVTPETLTVKASGLKRHFIGKTETMRENATVTMRFTMVAGKLQLTDLTESSEAASRR